MTIVDTNNVNNNVSNMSKRVKTKPKVRASVGSEMTRKNVADKESADRIAAAEAMSCLSSTPFILPSSETVPKAMAGQSVKPDPSINIGNNEEGVYTSTSVSKRGKSRNRGRGGKRSPSKQTHANSSLESNIVVSQRNAVASVTELSKPKTVPPSTVVKLKTSTTSISQASLIAQQLSNIVKLQKEKQENAMPSHSNIKFSLQQMLELKKAQGQEQSQTSNNAVLKLPLTVSTSDSNQAREPSSPSSIISNESIELPQTTVDHILNQNKYDTPEASLPLKKRRLQTYKDGEVPQKDSTSPSQAVVDLTTDKEDKSKEQQGTARVLSSGVYVNPQTSLMLLSEIQMALHQDEDGDLPLHIAVAQENSVMVQKFVHLMTISGKSVDKYNKSQQTPLHIAIELQFDQAVSVLLMAGANPSLVNKQGDSSIHLAIKHNTINSLALMLIKSQHKTDINARNFEGLAPLHLAVIRNQIEMVKVLIRCGADINIQDGKSGRTPLFHAVEGNQLALVMLFRQCNANLELTNYAGITALMAAQAKGFSEASSILMVGLDPKAIIEHKEKEKLLMPNKKMPIPRIPSKAHLIVSGIQRGVKKENNDGENETSLSNTGEETQKDAKPKLEEKGDNQQLSEYSEREQRMIIEMKNDTPSVKAVPMEIDKTEVVEDGIKHIPPQLTMNIPIKKEKPKRNKQKKMLSKSENNLGSDQQTSSIVVHLPDSQKGTVDSVADTKVMVSTTDPVSNAVRSIPVSNGPNKSAVTTENVTSINARTASLLAAHLKSVKNSLTKQSSSYPLNLSSNGKEAGNLEKSDSIVSSGS
ncbi:nuclear factor NF-kappa-B p100 subunit-like [Saccostrea echinata]|uniref:nuclear factor NF-kappa-B p100 subunit-like n=1 Tax=Saccostrea echinata TaxID=191078 RepID=UPI002A818FB7|nr:nuclear factor NF-kappa-B p100 subunit-like [Saccostrea echinata]